LVENLLVLRPICDVRAALFSKVITFIVVYAYMQNVINLLLMKHSNRNISLVML
jgi:hypothetical protein